MIENTQQEEDQAQQPGKPILKEDEGKTTPPTAPKTSYLSDGDVPSTRPEQAPEVPPQERTQGIP